LNGDSHKHVLPLQQDLRTSQKQEPIEGWPQVTFSYCNYDRLTLGRQGGRFDRNLFAKDVVASIVNNITLMSQYKVVVYVPLTHTDVVRDAIGSVGGGVLGNYSFCSFSTRGVGRFKPEVGAHPTIGTVGVPEQVEEERIEVTCDEAVVKTVVAAIRRVHPYEEVAMDVWELKTL
jgi:hypothetical protein